MNTRFRTTLFAATAIASLANPLSAIAGSSTVRDFVASYPQVQTQSVTDPSQDYIDSLSGKPFVATKRVAHSEPSLSQDGNAYIESFSTRTERTHTNISSFSKMGEGLTGPATWVR